MKVETVTLITAIVGAVCGVTGAVLGGINTWHNLQRNKVRLKVIPLHIIPLDRLHNPCDFGLEVINLSEFPVVISDVGFQLDDGRCGTLMPVCGIEQGGSLPVRLESRCAYSKMFSAGDTGIPWNNIRCAYAKTQCGTMAAGTSDALTQLINKGCGHDS